MLISKKKSFGELESSQRKSILSGKITQKILLKEGLTIFLYSTAFNFPLRAIVTDNSPVL